MASDYRLFFLDYDDFTNRRRLPQRYMWLWSVLWIGFWRNYAMIGSVLIALSNWCYVFAL